MSDANLLQNKTRNELIIEIYTLRLQLADANFKLYLRNNFRSYQFSFSADSKQVRENMENERK